MPTLRDRADQTQQLLAALLATVGRATISPAQLYDLVSMNGKTTKQIIAFNLADGTRTQTEIAKKLRLDSGNFSRTVTRWVEAGVIFRLGESRDAKLLHIYRVPTAKPKG